jgi:urease alpha subunit
MVACRWHRLLFLEEEEEEEEGSGRREFKKDKIRKKRQKGCADDLTSVEILDPCKIVQCSLGLNNGSIKRIMTSCSDIIENHQILFLGHLSLVISSLPFESAQSNRSHL